MLACHTRLAPHSVLANEHILQLLSILHNYPYQAREDHAAAHARHLEEELGHVVLTGHHPGNDLLAQHHTTVLLLADEAHHDEGAAGLH